MKAINYLKKIEMMDARINTRLQEIESLQALATKTTAVLGSEKVQSTGSQSQMSDCVDRIVDMKEQLNADIDKFIDYKNEVFKLMDAHCTPDCVILLYAKYFRYKDWDAIAKEMEFTYKWVSGGLHQRALSQVQKGLDERSRA